MAMLTLGEAARLTGLGKTTIQRSIKAGRLSATRTEFGSYQIDAAELHRVYPIPAPVDATVAETHREEQDATPDVTPLLEAQINALRQVSELLRQQLDDTREDRDRWRAQAERLALPAPATAVASRPWWRRIGSKA
jgi:excisionase family DNA binding protein